MGTKLLYAVNTRREGDGGELKGGRRRAISGEG